MLTFDVLPVVAEQKHYTLHPSPATFPSLDKSNIPDILAKM